MNPGRILLRLGMLWVFLVIGGAVLAYLFTSPTGLPGLRVVFASSTCAVSPFGATNAGAVNRLLSSSDADGRASANLVLTRPFVVVDGEGSSIKYTSTDDPKLGSLAGWAFPSNAQRYVAFTASSVNTAPLVCGTVNAAVPLGATLGALTGDEVAVAASTTTAFGNTSYNGITQAVFGFVPLAVGLAFVLPVIGSIGIGGYAAYNKLRSSREV